MSIQKWSDEIWVAQLSNEPAFSEDISALQHEIDQGKSIPHTVVDLSAVTHLNSSSLTNLLRLRKWAIDNDRKLRLAAMIDSVWVVVLTTGLDKIFEFSPDVPTALAGLQLDQG